MTVSEKIKTIDNKIEQNKAQYYLNRQTAKISTLSSGNDGKYEFLDRWRCFTRRRLVRKSCYNQRFGYSQLGWELKKQTDIAKKQKNKKKTDITKEQHQGIKD